VKKEKRQFVLTLPISDELPELKTEDINALKESFLIAVREGLREVYADAPEIIDTKNIRCQYVKSR
jgi:hypothetical protein